MVLEFMWAAIRQTQVFMETKVMEETIMKGNIMEEFILLPGSGPSSPARSCSPWWSSPQSSSRSYSITWHFLQKFCQSRACSSSLESLRASSSTMSSTMTFSTLRTPISISFPNSQLHCSLNSCCLQSSWIPPWPFMMTLSLTILCQSWFLQFLGHSSTPSRLATVCGGFRPQA